jgi:hypothetical protein
VLMQDAKRCASIDYMPEQERTSRRNRRENMKLLIEAIHRRFDVTRGGQAYLADVTPTSFTYVSAVLKNDRGCGDELAHKIEIAFRLPREWLDHAHPDIDLDELATKHVPLRPGARIGRKAPAKKRTSDKDEVARLRRVVEQLAAQVAEIANKPK